MQFNSTSFLIFFPVVTVLYVLLPAKVRVPWLLAASYFFYMCWNPKYALLIGLSTVATWGCGLALGSCSPDDEKKRKLILIACLVLNLGILGLFKYGNFVLENAEALVRLAGISCNVPRLDLLLPVGISFYTFQALGYTVDVYRGEIKPEKSLLYYALFVSFFPQLVAGPIERSGRLLGQLHEVPQKPRAELLNYKRITDGLIVMLWGFFLKMVIADRIAVIADTVFDSYYVYHTFALITGAVAFAIQIYCDFASYSTIAIGAAQVMGITLMENFNTPYFARSTAEFWSRWHISLSTWLRDYVFFPLWRSQCSKARAAFNLMVTFLISGLWHGASWNYVIWGAMHGFFQLAGKYTKPYRKRLCKKFGIPVKSASHKLGQMFLTFLLVDSTYIVFRTKTLSDAVGYFVRLFTTFDPWALSDGTLYTLGLDRSEFNIVFLAVAVLTLVDVIRYRTGKRIDEFLDGETVWFKWLAVFGLIFAVVVFGRYGSGFDAQAFIYFQF